MVDEWHQVRTELRLTSGSLDKDNEPFSDIERDVLAVIEGNQIKRKIDTGSDSRRRIELVVAYVETIRLNVDIGT